MQKPGPSAQDSRIRKFPSAEGAKSSNVRLGFAPKVIFEPCV